MTAELREGAGPPGGAICKPCTAGQGASSQRSAQQEPKRVARSLLRIRALAPLRCPPAPLVSRGHLPTLYQGHCRRAPTPAADLTLDQAAMFAVAQLAGHSRAFSPPCHCRPSTQAGRRWRSSSAPRSLHTAAAGQQQSLGDSGGASTSPQEAVFVNGTPADEGAQGSGNSSQRSELPVLQQRPPAPLEPASATPLVRQPDRPALQQLPPQVWGPDWWLSLSDPIQAKLLSGGGIALVTVASWSALFFAPSEPAAPALLSGPCLASPFFAHSTNMPGPLPPVLLDLRGCAVPPSSAAAPAPPAPCPCPTASSTAGEVMKLVDFLVLNLAAVTGFIILAFIKLPPAPWGGLGGDPQEQGQGQEGQPQQREQEQERE